MRGHGLVCGAAALVVACGVALPSLAQQGSGRGEGPRDGSGGSGRARGGAACASYLDELDGPPLTAAEIADVVFLREEEKLARDVYLVLGDRWELPIFTHIASSEQRHMDRVLDVLDRFDIPDPVVDDSVGVFADAEIQGLYDSLVTAGTVSLPAALEVGATIEDLDIADLAELVESSDNAVVRFVAYNLMKGSRNHLRSFVAAVGAQGVVYRPQYLDVDVFESIVDSPRETRVVYDEDGDPLSACGGAGRGLRRGGRGHVGCTGGASRGGGRQSSGCTCPRAAGQG